jgi:hypothetical protein
VAAGAAEGPGNSEGDEVAVAATNAERVGSSDSVGTPVSTVNAGAPDGPVSYPSGNMSWIPSHSVFLICASM